MSVPYPTDEEVEQFHRLRARDREMYKDKAETWERRCWTAVGVGAAVVVGLIIALLVALRPPSAYDQWSAECGSGWSAPTPNPLNCQHFPATVTKLWDTNGTQGAVFVERDGTRDSFTITDPTMWNLLRVGDVVHMERWRGNITGFSQGANDANQYALPGDPS